MSLKSKIYQSLRYTQKYTGTDNVYLAHGGFWLTLQKTASFLSILSAVAFANLLSKETYGTYQYILSMLGILIIPTLTSMKTAITQAVARGYEGSLYPAIRTKIKWGILGSAGSIVLSVYYFLQGNPILGAAFLMAAIFLPFLNPFSLYAYFLEGKKLFKLLSIYTIISQVISISVMILIVFLTNNVLIILLTYLVAHVLVGLIFFKITIKKFRPNTNEDPKTIPFGTQMSLIKIIPTIARELDQILIWHFLGAAQVAIYSFAQKIPTQISGNLSILNQLAFPKMSARSREELTRTLPQKVARLYLLIIPIGLLYILAVPYIFRIFFPQYGDSIIYAQMLSFFIFLFPLSLIGQTFEAKMEKKNIFILNTFSPILRIAMLLILTPTLGILGVILARLINSAATHLLSIALFFFRR